MAQNTRKLVGVILMLAMLVAAIAALTIPAAAADGDVTIAVKANTGTLSGTTSISWTSGDYSVVNYKGTSTNAIRTSDSDHFRCYVGNKLTISGGNMSQVVITCTGSSYMLNNASNKLSEGWTVSASGTTLTYTATSGSATELTITIGKQSRLSKVVITPAVATGADCDHDSLECGDTCPECETYIKEHKYSNNCVAECENGCGTANPNYAEHVYDGDYDVACNVCTATREVNFPAADSELTITEANTIGAGMTHDTTTSNKYYVTGVVESIVNTTYGNLYIQDDEGNKLYVYGTYSADGSLSYANMTEKPVVGMTITVYGVIGNFNGAQMKNAWITEMKSDCAHEYEYDCSKACSLCGIELRPEAVCVSDAAYECLDGNCEYCGEVVAGLDHAYDDQWDPECNYGCGETREVEERPEMSEATVDFSSTAQRTEYSTSAQIWANGGLTVTNNKGSSTSNVGNYSNPARFYKSSTVIIKFSGMTQLVIDCSNTGEAKYSTPWGDMLTAAGFTYTVENKVYTITFAEPVDSITLTCSAQVRANSITATAVKASEPECEHEYTYACDKVCALCYEITNPDATHTITHVEAKAATCYENGNIAYWYCEHCGIAWADEALTQQTNLKNVVLPMAHADATHVEAKAATCYENGNIEYWYCETCGQAWLDEACTLNTNLKAVVLPMAHTNVVHVEAVAPTCTAMGNLEFWYCDVCGQAWLDAACTLNTNLKAVKLPATGVHTFVDGDCTDCDYAVVAQIGDVYYEDLASAIAAAVDGDTIVLLKDVAVDKYIDVAYQKQEGDTYDDIVARVLTLDLNGKTISTGEGYKFSNFGVIYVGLKQTLTITNGTVTCNVKNEVTVGGYGVINLENCTLINEAGAPAFCIYQSKPGDQYNGDAYGEGIYTGTGSIGEGVEIDGNIEIQGTLVLGEEEITATFKGAGVRYAKGNGSLEDPAKVSIRFGYEFSDISLVKAWGWSYSANGKTLYVDGKYSADNVTNLVLTNIPTAFLGAEITVELWYTVEIDGVDVTIYDGGNARVTADVLANTAKYDSNVNAVAYAKAALYLAGNEDYKAEYDAWIGKED